MILNIDRGDQKHFGKVLAILGAELRVTFDWRSGFVGSSWARWS
jgi:hypothetical protein